MINIDNIDLPRAIKLIKTLEKQLEEVNVVSKEYENEMENVLKTLQTELSKLQEINKEYQINKRNLEIRVEELETENACLIHKTKTLTKNNDKLLEENILLEHEVCDLRKYIDSNPLHSIYSDKSSKSSIYSRNSLTVSTNGSSLIVKPLCKNSYGNEMGPTPTIKESHSIVVATTIPMSLST